MMNNTEVYEPLRLALAEDGITFDISQEVGDVFMRNATAFRFHSSDRKSCFCQVSNMWSKHSNLITAIRGYLQSAKWLSVDELNYLNAMGSVEMPLIVIPE